MKKVFIDTNIIIDVLLGRKPFLFEALNIFQLADDGIIELYASVLSFVNAMYVARKELGKGVAFQKLKEFYTFITVSPIGNEELVAAFAMEGKDFEDDLQYCSALDAECDVIVTRDLEGFSKDGEIAVMSPKEFLNSLIGAS